MHKTKNRKNTINSLINAHIMLKFCTWVAHDKAIPHANSNSEICTDVIYNNFMLLESEHFHQKALNFKGLYHQKLKTHI